MIEQQVHEREFIVTGSRKGRNAPRVLPAFVTNTFMGDKSVFRKANLLKYLNKPSQKAFSRMWGRKLTEKKIRGSVGWTLWNEFLTFCFIYSHSPRIDDLKHFRYVVSIFLHHHLLITQPSVGNFLSNPKQLEVWCTKLCKVYLVFRGYRWKRGKTLKQFFPCLDGLIEECYYKMDGHRRKPGKTPIRASLLRKIYAKRLPYLNRDAGKLSKMDSILCYAHIIQTSHKRAGLWCRTSRKDDPDVEFLDTGLLFDHMRRNVLKGQYYGQATDSTAVAVDTIGHKTILSKCNRGTCTNGSDVSILAKSTDPVFLAEQYTIQDTFYFIHRWEFSDVEGSKIDFSSLPHGKLTPILPDFQDSRLAITKGLFIRLLRKLVSPYVTQWKLQFVSGHSCRVGRTLDLMSAGVPRTMIAKSGGWDSYDTVLIYLFGGYDALVSVASLVPHTDFIPLSYF